MKKALGTCFLVLGAFFISTPSYAADYSGEWNCYPDGNTNFPCAIGYNQFVWNTPSDIPTPVSISAGTSPYSSNISATTTGQDVTPSFGLPDPWISGQTVIYVNVADNSGSPTIVSVPFYNNGGNPNDPAGDDDTSTHIVGIVSPVLYSTTTSPIPVKFTIYTSSSSPPMGYDITFVNTLSFQSKSVSGWLTDTGYSSSYYGTTFLVSTTTPLTGDGTWKMTVSLWSGGLGGPDPDPMGTVYSYLGRSVDTYFGLNFHDNAQHAVFPSFVNVTYASTSCVISFAGTFNLPDCAGYLLHPTTNGFLPYQNVSETLSTRFPFSYFSSIANTWSSLVASTTQNAPEWKLPLHTLGIGSTTSIGNILPDITIFSTTTVQRYMPAGTLAVLKGLISLALILTLFADLFYSIKNLLRPKSV